tara:strand:- start:471 stop:656 length:186 start_codon:yes stop_codon:yes gene_type:complete
VKKWVLSIKNNTHILIDYGLAPVELGFCQPPNVALNEMLVVTCGDINCPKSSNEVVPDNPK